MYIKISELGYGFIPEVFRQFFSEMWGQLALLVLAVAVIFWLGDKKARGVLVYPVVLLALTVYNPFVANIFIEKIGLEERYYRYLWLLPIPFAVAYALVLLCGKLKKLPLKLLLCAGCGAALIFFGNAAAPRMTEAQNLYKVSWEVIDISQAVSADSDSEENTCLYMDTELLPLRSFDPSVLAVFSRSQLLSWSVDVTNEKAVRRVIRKRPASYTLALVMRYGLQIEKEIFKERIELCEVDYIIPRNDLGLDEYLKSMGYVQIYDNGVHSIYRVDK